MLWFNYLSAILDPIAMEATMEMVMLNCGLNVCDNNSMSVFEGCPNNELLELLKTKKHVRMFVQQGCPNNTSLKVFNSCLWYLDSGCSRHMTGDKSLFKTLKENIKDYVMFDDGSHAQVLGKGTIEIPGLPLLKDVLYIKG